MKIKKLISISLATIMLLSTFVTSFAEEVSTKGTSHDVNVSFGSDESFVVIIPTDFVIDETMTATADVKAYDVMINYGSVLEVTLSGADYADTSSWELENIAAEEDTLTYIIGTEEGLDDIVDGSVVLSVESKEAVDTEKTETMHFTVIDEIQSSGEYMDTLTFTVDVVGSIKNLFDVLDDDGKARVSVGDRVQLEIPATYSLRKPTWESSDDGVIVVNATGLAIAIGNGRAVITYTLGDITGEIIFIVGEIEEPETFEFSVLYEGDMKMFYFTAEKGMTWGQWINSEYNTKGFIFDEDGAVRAPCLDGRGYLDLYDDDNTITNGDYFLYDETLIKENYSYRAGFGEMDFD